MVSCIVPGCKNYSEKTGKTVSYHKIPKDHRTDAWRKRIRRLDMPPLENCHVCSDHFLPSCFEVDFRAQLMGQKGKADLKDDAIPSVFSYSYGPKPKMRDYHLNFASKNKGIEKLVLYYLLLIYAEDLNCTKIILLDLPTRFAFALRYVCGLIRLPIRAEIVQALIDYET